MKLNLKPFESIKSGRKTIELRLNDEKRQQVKVGDFIEFSLTDDSAKKIQTRVIALHKYSSFKELFAAFPKEKFGYGPDENASPEDMDAFYSKENQEKYGVLGIELRCTELQRFIDAQDGGYGFGDTYETALDEIKHGMKCSCWMWYVFPQIAGLGMSSTTAYFSIKDLTEARDYYDHPVLGERLREISSVLLDIDESDPMVVFGDPDCYKLRSCMTLFKYAVPEDDLFRKVLDKFCMGSEDTRTLDLI
jgi:uncharacterized protein (DUF1810 family)